MTWLHVPRMLSLYALKTKSRTPLHELIRLLLKYFIMTKIDHFVSGAIGTYKINNQSSLQNLSNGYRLVIGRSNKSNKPNKVLIWINPQTGIRQYISGLFYVNETDFCFDCAGQTFRLSYDTINGTAEIYLCESCRSIIHDWFKKVKSHI